MKNTNTAYSVFGASDNGDEWEGRTRDVAMETVEDVVVATSLTRNDQHKAPTMRHFARSDSRMKSGDHTR